MGKTPYNCRATVGPVLHFVLGSCDQLTDTLSGVGNMGARLEHPMTKSNPNQLLIPNKQKHSNNDTDIIFVVIILKSSNKDTIDPTCLTLPTIPGTTGGHPNLASLPGTVVDLHFLVLSSID